MSLIENIWTLTTIAIIFFVLSTDPKNASSGNTSNNIFSSVSEGQNSVRLAIWVTIFCFYILSLLISYY